MEQIKKYKAQISYISNHYSEKIDPLFIIGCYCILYSTGHIEKIDHEYTTELICDKIDNCLQEIDNMKKFDKYEDSILETDVELEDHIESLFATMNNKDFKKLINKIIDDSIEEKKEIYNTTHIIPLLNTVDYNRYYYEIFTDFDMSRTYRHDKNDIIKYVVVHCDQNKQIFKHIAFFAFYERAIEYGGCMACGGTKHAIFDINKKKYINGTYDLNEDILWDKLSNFIPIL